MQHMHTMSASHVYLCFDRGRCRGGDDLPVSEACLLFFLPCLSLQISLQPGKPHIGYPWTQYKFPGLLMLSYRLTRLHTLGNTKTHMHSTQLHSVGTTSFSSPVSHILKYCKALSYEMHNSVFNSKSIHKNVRGQCKKRWINKDFKWEFDPISSPIFIILSAMEIAFSLYINPVWKMTVLVSHKNVKLSAHICPHPFAKL